VLLGYKGTIAGLEAKQEKQAKHMAVYGRRFRVENKVWKRAPLADFSGV